MDQAAIKCEGIKKSYGEDLIRVDALKGIDLEIYPEKLTLLVGPSGSGKTTLLFIITTILTPDEGKLFLLGQEMSQMSESKKAEFCRKSLGIVFQSLFLIPTLSVVENVSMPLLVAGMPQKEAQDKAMVFLKKMQIDHRSEISPSHLSKGQQQRVAIARALVNDSKIIVCDEPTSALDQAAGLEIMAVLKELALHSGKAVLVVTHDHRIFSFADRIIHINDGQITAGKEHE